MTETNVEVLELLEQFLPGNNNHIPVLDAASQLAVRQYFENSDMEMTAGCLTLGEGEPQSVDLVLSHDKDVSKKFDSMGGAIIGPHFLGDEYFPNGLGIWVCRT